MRLYSARTRIRKPVVPHLFELEPQVKRTLDNPAPSATPPVPAPEDRLPANDAPPPTETDNGEPRMQAREAAPQNPLRTPDPDAELPNWEDHEQMLQHSPPQVHAHDSDGEEPTVDASDEELRDSSDDENIIPRVINGRASGTYIARPQGLGVQEITKVIESCKQYPQVTALWLKPTGDTLYLPIASQQLVVEFFEHHQSVQEVYIQFANKQSDPGIDVQLLTTLVRNAGLKELQIALHDDVPLTAEENKSITESVRNNQTLEILHLTSDPRSKLLAPILEALQLNSTLKMLKIRLEWFRPDIFEPLAALIRGNHALKELTFPIDEVDEKREHSKIIEALKENNTLEKLVLLSEEVLKGMKAQRVTQALMHNRNLRELQLPPMDLTQEALKSTTELIRNHPTLHTLSIGAVDMKSMMALAEAIRENPRLERIELLLSGLGRRKYGEGEQVAQLTRLLSTIGECPGLTSIQFDHVPDLGCVIDFLKTHPQIRSVGLAGLIETSRELHAKLRDLLTSSNQIIDLEINVDWEIERGILAPLSDEPLLQAVSLNRQNAEDTSAAGMGISAMLRQQTIAEPLPELPTDVTNLLAESIAFHLPQHDTRRIFDTVMPYAPPQVNEEM